jgi:16S rRNA (adenine1518-N6/adenine1519-N6)-dimethyltransferase
MSLILKRKTLELLKKQGIRPSKKLGQNFLIDEGAIKRVIEAGNISSSDIVLEVGPGLGVLTLELAKRAKKVIAVEKDRNMIGHLEGLGLKNLEIIEKDALRLDVEELGLKEYKIVANLPFYLTAHFMRRFLESKIKPSQMVLVVQKEVGQRICAKPPKMSILSVSVQVYADAEIVSYIPKRAFFPVPNVDSAIIRVSLKGSPISPDENDLFFKIVKTGFSQPRKQLANNLAKGLGLGKVEVGQWLMDNNIQPSQRAETLRIEEWVGLVKNF